jgi:hypothetical protein
MGYLFRIAVALIGLTLVRGLVYPRGWAGRTVTSGLFAVIGFAMVLPLAAYGRVGLIMTLAAAAGALFPYRLIAARFMRARTRAGLLALADDWGTDLTEDATSGRWDVARELGDKAIWVGNVLTHKGSINPSVRRREVGYMLAFVAELRREPPFLCSLMIGWEKPRYFEREWRATHVIHGEYLSLPFGDVGLASDRGRATGGTIEQLQPYDGFDELAERHATVLGTHQESFARVFNGSLLDEFQRVASQTYPYELNVTPTSVNIYTTYCGPDVQRANARLLEQVTERLESTT